MPTAALPARLRRRSAYLIATAATLVLLAGYAVTTVFSANAASTLISQGKPATASSTENATFPASAAVDGDTGTRWSSAFSDPQWIQVDLGATASITQVVLRWETAYGSAFQIQTSGNASTWTTIYSTTTGTGGTQTLNVTGSGRYVRLYGTARGTQYGYSLWEFQVYGDFGGTPPATGCGTANAAQGRPATASSTENAGTPASAAVDGNTGTRWSSAFSDPQWLQVDLGSSQTVCQVQISWEAAYASAFQVQVSANASSWTTIYSTTTGAGGNQTVNATGTGRYVRVYGTARATQWGYSIWELVVHVAGGTTPSSPPPTSTGPSNPPPDSFWGDTSTIPAAQNVVEVKVLNRTNGAYPDSQVYWSFNGQTHSIADTPYLDMPANSAGRMYFYVGSPNSQYFDFIEFTVGANVFNGNTTRVDAFGLKIAMRLHAHDGYDVQVGENYATFQESRAATFQRFIDSVPSEFKVLAQTQAPYRIIAPGSDPSFRAGGVNQNYFTAYAQQFGINAPTSDIFGCAGVLAADPTNCAALNRHVRQLDPSQYSNPAQYYLAAPANYYAKFWHDNAIGGLAYGFPYDDYAGQSSFISHGSPQWLEVAVGF
ncbi:MAG TPA: discoidin domain-containing protein [Rugosimonospora sp.]|nr:discoidin domain-containing protein [Rugosimonospora sp.]